MICKRCGADKASLINLGKKEHYDTLNVRNYVCTGCGHRFQTKEEYYREVQSQVDQVDLFANVRRANGG